MRRSGLKGQIAGEHLRTRLMNTGGTLEDVFFAYPCKCATAATDRHGTPDRIARRVDRQFLSPTTLLSKATEMLVNKIVQLAVFVLAIVWDWRCNAATAAVKLCGRELSDFMSRVCHAYNSPSWDVPTVIEQPAAVVRRRRRTGIVDECCVFGCTWEQLSSYCAISAKLHHHPYQGFIRSAARAAPVLGTVSPLLTWGRTLNTDLPSVEKDRYAYVAVYT
ncbi:jg11655 [Pararge aegeria aegeria]|uniref:Jg11655 protein n=2 Tax=Pararge aegeria TaxID=116150 RepID=A0A8S4RQG6_9NEOP|nr:jg11655 [Pararge aegeria aegeria]